MNSLKTHTINYSNLLLWLQISSLRSAISNRVSGLVTIFTKPLSLLASATTRSTQNASPAEFPTARTVRDLLSSLSELASKPTFSPHKPQKIYVTLKTKLWHAQFGAEKEHFELHIRGKQLEVIQVNHKPDICQVMDATGEKWIVFYEWVAECGFIRLGKDTTATS